jgi:AbrB family looped-hinge helix DNA binding protein
MPIRLTLDKGGRIVIPKQLRQALQLGPGDMLELERAGDELTLRPVRGTWPLVKEQGVWVFFSGQPLTASSTEAVLEQLRTERDRANLGTGT